jgi:hypothetical protein
MADPLAGKKYDRFQGPDSEIDGFRWGAGWILQPAVTGGHLNKAGSTIRLCLQTSLPQDCINNIEKGDWVKGIILNLASFFQFLNATNGEFQQWHCFTHFVCLPGKREGYSSCVFKGSRYPITASPLTPWL